MLDLSRLSPYRLEVPALIEKELELVRTAGRLETALHSSAARALSDAMSGIHSYYSNRIEGPSTHPITAELAAAGRLAPKETAGDPGAKYQQQALAGIAASQEMKRILFKSPKAPVETEAFIAFLHHCFTSRLPDELRVVKDDAGREDHVIPGEFRTGHVAVGSYVPPAPEELPGLLSAFGDMYRLVGPSVRNAMLLHHRLSWIHPFLDGNGRTCRLLTEAMLLRSGAGGAGLWSLARGLSKRKDEYLAALAGADSPRKGDYDGKGLLSMEMSERFVSFMLDVALDQVGFMSERLNTDQLLDRLKRFCEERRLVLGRDERAYALLKEALLSGPYERGRAADLVGLSSRRASDVIRECIQDKLLASPSEKGELRAAFPMYALSYLFPALFDTNDPQADMRAYCAEGKQVQLANEIADEKMPKREQRDFQFG